MLIKQEKRMRRHRRIRAKIYGTSKAPRFCIFRSNQYIYAQLIDDEKSKVIASAKGVNNVKQAEKVGGEIAKKAIEKKIEKVIFDRAGYKYHGKIKALAEGAREGGLKF